MRKYFGVAFLAALMTLVVAGTAGAAKPASAGPQTDTFMCDGTQVTVRVAPAVGTQDKDNVTTWGVGQIVGGGSGHLIPVAFSFSAVDTANGVTLFSDTQTKGNGNAASAQPTVQCSQTQTGLTVADLLQGEPLPPDLAAQGVMLTDPVALTFAVTAVHKP